MAIKLKPGGELPLDPLLHSPLQAPPTPPRGTPRPRPGAKPAAAPAPRPRPVEPLKPAASPRAFTPRSERLPGPLTSERGTGSGLSTSAAAQWAATEVRQDVLETTRLQLLQALELDPSNARTHAMLLVTLYRLGRFDALMQVLRGARQRGISGDALLGLARCRQMVEEEARAGRLPVEQHSEFLDYLGG